MANLTFPSNPTNGQKVTVNDKVFVYSNTTSRWTATRLQVLGNLTDDFTIDPPTITLANNNITVNALTNNFINFSVDKDAKISIDNQTTNATAVLYTANNTLKIDATVNPLENGIVVISAYDGRNTTTANFTFSIDNNPPFISLPQSSFTLATDGTATTVTATATDPENQPLTYTSSVSGGYANAITSVTNSANVYTITPSTDFADQGTAIVTFQVSDGVNIKTANASFTLSGLAGAGDVTNATYTNNSLALGNHKGSSGTNTADIEFCNSAWINPLNSSKLHLGYVDYNNSNIMRVAEISLTTPNDISSATGTATVVWSGTEQNASRGMWEDNGNKWVVALSTGALNIYNASTPYDFSTLGSPTTTVDFGGIIAGWVFNSTGTKLLAAQSQDNLFEYSTTTGWDYSVKTQENLVADAFRDVTNAGNVNTGGVIFHNNGEEFWSPATATSSGSFYNKIWDMTSAHPPGSSISPFDISNYNIQVINSQDYLDTSSVIGGQGIRMAWMDRRQVYMMIRGNSSPTTLYQYDVS